MNFIINGHEYATIKMRVLDQLNLTRRLAPALGAMVKSIGPSASKAAIVGDMTDEQAQERALTFIPIALDAIAGMSEADSNWVTLKCLECVQRKTDGGYGQVARGDSIMFDDMELPEMLQVVGRVIQENLASFFPQVATNA